MPSLRDAAQLALESMLRFESKHDLFLGEFAEEIAALGAALDEHEAYHVNNDKSAAVATDYYYNHDMSKCPVGVKLLLLNPGNSMTVGQYNGRDTFWKGWAPCPKVKT